MRGWLFVALSGCGRLGFDGLGGPPPGDGIAGVDVGPTTTLVDPIGGAAVTCHGACPTTGPGHHGTAYYFGGGSCLELADSAGLDAPRFTAAMWMNQSDAMPQVLFAKELTTGHASWSAEVGYNLDILFESYSGTDDELATLSGTVMLHQWVHVAITYDGTIKRIYDRGTDVHQSGAGIAIVTGTGHAWIGCDGETDTRYFTGALDELQIYDHALTASEIAALAAT